MKKNIIFIAAVFVLVLVISGSAFAEQATSVSQWGITWTFDKPATVGKFITGDWWVQGPVTVVKEIPAPTYGQPGRNGSQVNPPACEDQKCKQPWDDRLGNKVFYHPEVGAIYPLVLKPGDSLVSCISAPEKIGTLTADTIGVDFRRFPIRSAAVLTCLDQAPPQDAFRPPYVAGQKTIYRASQIRRDILPRLPVPPGAVPADCLNAEKSKAMIADANAQALATNGNSFANLCHMPSPYIQERFLQRLWLDHIGSAMSGPLHPWENMPTYAREITTLESTITLMLMLDDPQGKNEQMLRLFIQKGIDLWGMAKTCPTMWVINGGICGGRKWPVVFAGIMLGDREMMGNNNAYNQEDLSTYYGKGADGETVLWRGAQKPYQELPPQEWKEGVFAKTIGNGWRAENYRLLNGPTMIGEALGARLIGARQVWNHDAFFDYMDRWVKDAPHGTYEQPGGSFKASSADPCTPEEMAQIKPTKYEPFNSDFARIMWQTYRDKVDKIGTDTQAKWKK